MSFKKGPKLLQMKYFLTLCCFALVFVQYSCNEVPPFIDLARDPGEAGPNLASDTSYVNPTLPTPQERVVVVEDFSGVACNNCPKGNQVVADLIEEHDGRVIGMTLHAGNFAAPRPENVDTFLTPETTELSTFLNVVGYPSAAIDRFQFPTAFSLVIPQTNTWVGYTEERLAVAPPVNLEIIAEYDEGIRRFTATVKATYTQAMPDENPHNISIFMLESGIIDLQDTNDTDSFPSGKIQNYEHNHVVRDMMTPAAGTQLTSEPIVAGLTVEKEYTMLLKEKWHSENMNIVAFVHKTGDSKEILQGAEEHVE